MTNAASTSRRPPSFDLESDLGTLHCGPAVVLATPDRIKPEAEKGVLKARSGPKRTIPTVSSRTEPRHPIQVSVLIVATRADDRLVSCVESLSNGDLRVAGQMEIIVVAHDEDGSVPRYRQLLRPFRDLTVLDCSASPLMTRFDALTLAFLVSRGGWIICVDSRDYLGKNSVDQLLIDATHRHSKMVVASCGHLCREKLVRAVGPAFRSSGGDFELAALTCHADRIRALFRRDVWVEVNDLVSKVTTRALKSIQTSTNHQDPELLRAWDQVADALFHAIGVYVCGRSVPISAGPYFFGSDEPDYQAPRYDLISKWWRVLHEGWTLPSELKSCVRELAITTRMYALQRERRSLRMPTYPEFLAVLDEASLAA